MRRRSVKPFMSEFQQPFLVLKFESAPLRLLVVGNHLQSPLLFAMRFVWGIQLMQAGVGKLLNIETPIGYFTDLGIPFPVENAWLVGFTETFGGLFLALGLLSRLTAIPLIINFIVAYITTEQDALKNLLSFDTDKFSLPTRRFSILAPP